MFGRPERFVPKTVFYLCYEMNFYEYGFKKPEHTFRMLQTPSKPFHRGPFSVQHNWMCKQEMELQTR